VKVRVNVPNEDGKLKPGMFVRATVRSQVATDGRVMNPALAGKWISPMHPEIVKDGPGTCDICGMALVPAKDLGYVALDENAEAKPLAIPATAALLTGKRAVVYVELPGADQPTYEGREVELGARAGDYYIVHTGVSEGERVVVNGNFKIDSAMQILAKRSMMMPKPDSDQTAVDPALVTAADGLFKHYVAIHEALVADDAAKAQQAAAAAEGEAHLPDWLTDAALRGRFRAIDAAFQQIGAASDLDAQRVAFEGLSMAMKDVITQTGLSPGQSVQAVHCPMAFESRGADWLQPSGGVRNPYFGPVMLDCGSVQQTLVDEHGHAPH
jgi:Cu(I)/Ag(I) efflux system membrane fusion protein